MRDLAASSWGNETSSQVKLGNLGEKMARVKHSPSFHSKV